MKKTVNGSKIATIIVLLFFTYVLLTKGALSPLPLLHSVNLTFHEAGHTIFRLLGEFMGFLGGTLLQILIPLILFLYFLRDGQRFASFVMLWWVGENFVDLAPYIGDARTQTISLIGGEHDFAYLLGKLNILSLDNVLERVFLTVGFSLMFLSILFLGQLVYRNFMERNI